MLRILLTKTYVFAFEFWVDARDYAPLSKIFHTSRIISHCQLTSIIKMHLFWGKYKME